MYKDDICPIHNLAAFDGFLWIRTYKASRGFPATSLLSFLCNFLSKLFVIYYRCGRKRYSSETPTFPGVVLVKVGECCSNVNRRNRAVGHTRTCFDCSHLASCTVRLVT